MKTISLFAGIALAAPAPLFAQQAGPPAVPGTGAAVPDAATALPPRAASSTGAGDPDTIVVTANRAPVPIDQVAQSVTVLDKAAIDRAADFTVSDVLVRTPGVTLSRTGGFGTATSLRIRGAEGDQTVVVIDGVKLNDPSSVGGGYNFANLLVGDASRIEVLRGPGSIPWGSQAIGGVVNIVTPLPEGLLEGSFDVEAGSRETVSGRVAIGGRTGPLAWRLGGQAFTTDGISALAPSAGGVERDGYTNQSVAGRALLDLATDVSAEVRGYYSNARVEIDGFGVDTLERSLNREFVGYAGLNVGLFDGRFRNRVGYGYTSTDRENFNPARRFGTGPGRAQTFDGTGRNERFEYQGSLAIDTAVDATFGVERETSRFRTVSPGANPAVPVAAPARARAEIDSVYGQLNVRPLDGLTLTGGVRHDDHNRFGGQTQFSGGGVWALASGTVLRASYSEGFKAPSLFQLFSDFGNAALEPERAKGWEVGVEQRLLDGRAAIGGVYFERRSRNLIGFFSCSFTSADPLCFLPGTTTRRFGYYANVSRAFARGIEAVARVDLMQGLSLDANYSWTLSEDRSAGAFFFGRQLPRRPRHAWNVAANYTVADGPAFGAAVRRSGDTFDNGFDTTRLPSYTLIDLRAELPVSSTLRLFVRGDNVFDEDNVTAAGFNSLGRSIYAGFRGRF